MRGLLLLFRKPLGRLSMLLLTALFISSPSVGSAADYSKYHNYDEMTRALRELVNAHSSIAELVPLGETLEGRTVWAVEIAGGQGAPADERPALFIGAGFEGDQLIGSELALFTIEYLLTNYESNDDVKQRIDNYTFYIVPRVNPDGTEMMFAGLQTGQKTNTKPYDDDNDGRIDEDGPDDINNDGFITAMRVKDIEGDYMIDPAEPRLMKKADPKKGEKGEYKVFWEGLDNDGDGFINEDAKGGVDLNRNFQHAYPYYKKGAGWHMISENESRALMDYVLEKRNIAVILTFGASDNLVSPPGSRGEMSSEKLLGLFEFAESGNAGYEAVGNVRIAGEGGGRRFFRGFGGFGQQQQQSNARRPAGRRAATTVNMDDISYFNTVSSKYKEMTGINNTPFVRKPEGTFFQYGYFQYGVLSLSTTGWGIETQARRGGGQGQNRQQPAANPQMARQMRQRPGAARGGAGQGAGNALDMSMIKWMDNEGIDGFVDWQSVSHPELGDVEVGGFKPYSVTNPPASKIAELGQSHAEFAVYLASLFADIEIADTEVTNHGGGIFRIKAKIRNNGFLPTSLQHGVASRSVRGTMVQLGVDPSDIISGNRKTEYFTKLNGSGKVIEYEWLVKGRSGQNIELKVVSQKGGTANITLTLPRQ